MGRKKIRIQKISNDRNRQVTYFKRKSGLLKKAYELSTLCGCDISLIIFNDEEGLVQYSTSDIDKMLDRFKDYKGKREKFTNTECAQFYTNVDVPKSPQATESKKKGRFNGFQTILKKSEPAFTQKILGNWADMGHRESINTRNSTFAGLSGIPQPDGTALHRMSATGVNPISLSQLQHVGEFVPGFNVGSTKSSIVGMPPTLDNYSMSGNSNMLPRGSNVDLLQLNCQNAKMSQINGIGSNTFVRNDTLGINGGAGGCALKVNTLASMCSLSSPSSNIESNSVISGTYAYKQTGTNTNSSPRYSRNSGSVAERDFYETHYLSTLNENKKRAASDSAVKALSTRPEEYIKFLNNCLDSQNLVNSQNDELKTKIRNIIKTEMVKSDKHGTATNTSVINTQKNQGLMNLLGQTKVNGSVLSSTGGSSVSSRIETPGTGNPDLSLSVGGQARGSDNTGRTNTMWAVKEDFRNANQNHNVLSDIENGGAMNQFSSMNDSTTSNDSSSNPFEISDLNGNEYLNELYEKLGNTIGHKNEEKINDISNSLSLNSFETKIGGIYEDTSNICDPLLWKLH
ncbi:Myocyte-specific enhancer factor 2B [Zancudomyces culisetae]|uniref:Myocyte-specific enhancer factor 2B n=1 Tax=Zancudomyces culisetae TaxID=1213189 RepID=A0A1R1PZP3_ZANCU|nr:Myocyte-specific enhancer factor 2B [Zancudomyces culisetae]|eukprot:OMH86410.1 Myocyte-specific enhancer factor 2B [Zancudomyces culisetae]